MSFLKGTYLYHRQGTQLGYRTKAHLVSSMGVPQMVTTTFVAEQIGWKDKNAIYTADTPEEYVQKNSEAYSDPSILNGTRSNLEKEFKRDCSPILFKQTISQLISDLC